MMLIRSYKLSVGAVEFDYGRCRYEIDSGYQNTVKRATIWLYNVSEEKYNQFKREDIVRFSVGDGKGGFPVLFLGRLMNPERRLDGADEAVMFSCWSGGLLFRDKKMTRSFDDGTNARQVLSWLTSELERLGIIISISDDVTKKINALNYPDGICFIGNMSNALRKFGADFEESFRLENETVFYGRDGINEYEVSTSKANLIGPPSITITGAECDSDLIPQLRVGDTINLSSQYFSYASAEKTVVSQQNRGGNGPYRVQNFTHIGDTHESDWKTKLTLLVKPK